jgi:hypothetical protein
MAGLVHFGVPALPRQGTAVYFCQMWQVHSPRRGEWCCCAREELRAHRRLMVIEGSGCPCHDPMSVPGG